LGRGGGQKLLRSTRKVKRISKAQGSDEQGLKGGKVMIKIGKKDKLYVSRRLWHSSQLVVEREGGFNEECHKRKGGKPAGTTKEGEVRGKGQCGLWARGKKGAC